MLRFSGAGVSDVGRVREHNEDSAFVAPYVALVADGLTNKQIADRLFISHATARNHLTSILGKLNLPDRFQLAVYAFRRGLVLCPQTGARLRMSATMKGRPARRSSGEQTLGARRKA